MPPVVTGRAAGSFPRGVLLKRHPALIERVGRATPYPPDRRAALGELLRDTSETGRIAPLDPDARDAGRWREWGAPRYEGRLWTDVPFLWAESFFYRELLNAVGYFGPGPWRGIDPFAPSKRAELAGASTDSEMAALERLPTSEAERDAALLNSSLWGNRADLGFRLSAGDAGLGERVTGLVSDDSARLWEALGSGGAGPVCLVADNAGPELLPDLVLADRLLRTGRASSVVLHLKPYPYYVSDATTADALACLERLSAGPPAAAGAGQRLRRDVTEGRLVLRAHPFSCAPLAYAEMPDDLRDDFASAKVTLMKGDLNYRRLVGDRLWPATTPFAEATSYFPGPVAALRTLKSDVVTGLTPQTLRRLDESEGSDGSAASWRTSGTHALVQFSAGG
ncbi:DUF89 family protein [Streptomyces tsukubensis]|uniref:Damage-control phosphatase ARMT1-like metal-binding domain-containing protein n=1 Tax=Streptomyces tsukubensis TaxID=83656 RepID=A0A1V4AAN5_9ACTN|nr:hypothetical protein B1H18_12780 [Streptomyces tsukubensis]QFR98223.1 DUF89 family protein [Streptomyces tsukubensis]